MHIDARELENNSTIRGDICVIGAGAAGISIALEWMNTPYDVILLEGGGFEYDDDVQDLYKGESTGQKYFPLKSSRLHYFGGTTGHWAGMCSPLDDIDFQKRDWVPNSGWPISRNDLDPFYAGAQNILELGPYEYNLNYWQEEVPNLNPFPLDERVIRNKMWQYSQAQFGDLYRDTVTDAENIHLYTYANVIDITANESVSAIDEVVVKNHADKTHTVEADHFILACGAIQNARLLLASNSQAPNGLGNDHDLVGRYFMEHLEIASSELWLFEPFPTDLYTWEYGVTRASAELGLTEEVQQEHRILNGTAALQPLNWARHTKPRIETWQDEDPRKAAESMFENWGEAAEKAEQDNEGSISKAFQLDTRIEQVPDPDSRITIGPETDELGVPRANLHWELSDLEWHSIRKLHELIGHHMGKAGIGRVRLRNFLRDPDNIYWPDGTNGGWHHMGTTRMSDDPKQGVVNPNCRIHGIENLYVAGSACYPTAGAPNPTLTLTALSLRLSDHIKNMMN